MLGLDINSKIQEIYATLQHTYTIPVEFLTWVRAMQQHNLGVAVPTSYGTFEENVAKVVMFQDTLRATDPREQWQDHDRHLDEDGFLEDEEFYAENTKLLESAREEMADQVSNVVAETVTNPKPDWDTLAAKNPLAAAFVKSLISTPDFEEEEDGGQWYEYQDDDMLDGPGVWPYSETDGDDLDYNRDHNRDY
jgi:hypothetical protein